MRQPPGPSRPRERKLVRSRGHERNDDILRIERAVLSGDRIDDELLLCIPQDDMLGSPLLCKASGEMRMRSGRLGEGLALLSHAVKGLAVQGLQRHMLEAMASLSMIHIRTGNTQEATTLLRFLRDEFERERSTLCESGRIAHALAKGVCLLDESAESSFYLHAAFDAYAREPQFTAYGALLLEVWTGLVPREELAGWESRTAWAEQQVHLGRMPSVYTAIIRGLGRFHDAQWEEAAALLADSGLAGLAHDCSLIARTFRYRACCRSESLGSKLREDELDELVRALRADESDLELKFHAEVLRCEWLRLRSDSRGAEEARRKAKVIWQLTRLPDQARSLSALAESGQQAEKPAFRTLDAYEGALEWRVYGFGGMRFVRSGMEAEAIRWKRKKTKELLVYLLLQPRYETPRDRVAELLFAESESGKAANRLYVAIHELKRTIREHLGFPGAVAIKEGIVRLHDRLFGYLDVEQYTTLARVGEQLWRQDRELALEMFEQACQLYGELLPEMPYIDWLDQYREALVETQTGMLRRLAQQASEERRFDRAESYVAEWVRIRPLEEEAHREMIALLINGGRKREACRWYDKWEQICRRELGSLPTLETRQLVSRADG